jgi:hypothetical protein
VQEGLGADPRFLPQAPGLTLTLGDHLRYLEAEYDAARVAPLSARKALLVVMLIDAYVDRLFAAGAGGDDILVYRASLAERFPALGTACSLAANKPDGPRLVVESVAVPPDDYPNLSLPDFMVSLYNDHTVQRLRIAMPDGSRLPAHETLHEAIAALRE